MAVRTSFRRVALLLCAALTFSGVAPAQADDLSDKKQQADAAAAQAQSDVNNSQASLNAADARVRAARARLAEAQNGLGAAQAEWDAATELEAQKAVALYEADQALQQAERELADAEAKVEAQREAINAYARSIVQDSAPLVNAATLINLDSTARLANRVQWNDTVLAVNQIDLDELRVQQAQIAAARTAAQDARERAAQAKQEAEAQTAVARAAQEAAAQAAADVSAALDEEQAARDAAAQALQNDQARLGQAQAASADIAAQIAAAEQARIAAEQARIAAEQARLAAEQAANQPPSTGPPPASNPNAGATIAATARYLAWPSVVRDDDGTPATAAYQQALQQFQGKPCVASWLPHGRVCALFVSTVMWSSGVDPGFGGGGNSCYVPSLTGYMDARPGQYQRFTYYGTSQLQPGDLLVPTSFGHISVYLGGGKQADASLSYSSPGYGGRTGSVKDLWPSSGYAYRFTG